jgi:hypothetical protein
MINGSDFVIALDDGDANPVIEFLVVGCILAQDMLTILAVSTNLRGKSPPVRFSTSLSVTSDFRLKPMGFLAGT